jgi:alpha-beta hydrolase superfamily lysophospholipase
MTGPDAATAQQRGRPDSAGPPGAVIVTHGGRSVSIEPTAALQPSVLRMIPVAGAIRHALRGTGTRVCRPRFRVRGWNGPEASPVQDLDELLDRISRDWGHIPVVLVGHSMGARAALRAAGHPLVTAVAGLAPWLPPTEPVSQLAGRRILLVHATADEVTSPEQTWAYADRARSVTQVATIEIRGGDHAMLRRARLWHRIAAEFTRLSLTRPDRAGEVATAFSGAAAGESRPVL